MPTRLIHITPQLPPNVGGVADYAVILGARVTEQTEGHVQSVYIQAGSKRGEAPAAAFDNTNLAGRLSAEVLAKAVRGYADEAEHAAVLVHYVGYGYHRRGCPWWLLWALQRLQAERPALRLLTMFHELYATSRKPWTSVFWLSPVQRYVAFRIANLSDGLMTNREPSTEELRKWTSNAPPVCFSPTFSNVGEPETLPPYDEREPYAVVFGRAGQKAALYEQHGQQLSQALRHMAVERIVDIGTPTPDEALGRLALPVEVKGVLPEREIAASLRQAAVGILKRRLAVITKSGALAAYMAHGVLPLVVTRGSSRGLLREGEHFITLRRARRQNARWPSEEHRQLGRQGYLWYQQKAHSRHAAAALRSLLAPTPAPPSSLQSLP